MRKAEKRRRGEERAAFYLEEVRQQGLRAQALDNKLRAERAAEKAQRANKKKAPRVINSMWRNEDAYKEV